MSGQPFPSNLMCVCRFEYNHHLLNDLHFLNFKIISTRPFCVLLLLLLLLLYSRSFCSIIITYTQTYGHYRPNGRYVPPLCPCSPVIYQFCQYSLRLLTLSVCRPRQCLLLLLFAIILQSNYLIFFIFSFLCPPLLSHLRKQFKTNFCGSSSSYVSTPSYRRFCAGWSAGQFA